MTAPRLSKLAVMTANLAAYDEFYLENLDAPWKDHEKTWHLFVNEYQRRSVTYKMLHNELAKYFGIVLVNTEYYVRGNTLYRGRDIIVWKMGRQ